MKWTKCCRYCARYAKFSASKHFPYTFPSLYVGRDGNNCAPTPSWSPIPGPDPCRLNLTGKGAAVHRGTTRVATVDTILIQAHLRACTHILRQPHLVAEVFYAASS